MGLSEAYLSIMRAPSRNIHGNWHDFLQHHLEVVRPGEFRPRFDEIYPRPQLIYALLVLIVPALIAYCEFLGTDDAARVKRSLDDLLDRARTADELHEAFLSDGNDDAV